MLFPACPWAISLAAPFGYQSCLPLSFLDRVPSPAFVGILLPLGLSLSNTWEFVLLYAGVFSAYAGVNLARIYFPSGLFSSVVWSIFEPRRFILCLASGAPYLVTSHPWRFLRLPALFIFFFSFISFSLVHLFVHISLFRQIFRVVPTRHGFRLKRQQLTSSQGTSAEDTRTAYYGRLALLFECD